MPEHPTIPDVRAEDMKGMGHAAEADLVVFMAGNQFMAMPELITTFRLEHPEVELVSYQTLPPKMMLAQILSGGAHYQGALLDVMPDVYTCVDPAAVEALRAAGLTDAGHVYLHNALTLLVPAGNPAEVAGASDLGRPEVRVSQPNPDYEDIALHALNMYRAVGGEALVTAVMKDKVAAGTTLLTTVHHRETPERLVAGQADVGPVWVSEAAHAADRGLPVETVEVGGHDQAEAVSYHACVVNKGRNAANGQLFVDFLRGASARRVFAAHGFRAPE